MRQLTIKTNKGHFLMIEADSTGKVILPTDVEYQELGRLSNLTEDDFALIVDNKNDIEQEDGTLVPTYRNYLYHDVQAPHIWKRSAKESFETLVHAHGFYLKNPAPLGIMAMTDKGIVDTTKDEWERSQSKTLHKPILLKIL